MNKSVNIYIVVEGQTEQTFIRDILAPELGEKNIFLNAVLIGKPGKKGGDIRFSRAKNDIQRLLRQRNDTYISTMFDYFRISSRWPGIASVRDTMSVSQIAKTIQDATTAAIKKELNNLHINVEKRFIPYLEMHEFEAMLFSDTEVLARKIGADITKIKSIITECGEPEAINTGPETAPSKRIMSLSANKYKKVVMGKNISEAIGIPKIRKECPHFNSWLNTFESLVA